jgi:hypothetical protein
MIFLAIIGGLLGFLSVSGGCLHEHNASFFLSLP